MRAAVYAGPSVNQREHCAAMTEGLQRHGIVVDPFRGNAPPADFVVTWGWRNAKRFRLEGRNVLVMERGYVGDRFAWTSLGWNGLNGRATWAPAPVNGERRFDKLFGRFVKPWGASGNRYALVVGQVPTDQAVSMIDIGLWYGVALSAMLKRGFDVRFRPHPLAQAVGPDLAPYLLQGSLEDALAGAACVVSWNSNTTVDAALAGVPVIACDVGSMARDVAAHHLDAPLITPDRREWCRELAWRQFTMGEIASGYAWEHVRGALHATSAPLYATAAG